MRIKPALKRRYLGQFLPRRTGTMLLFAVLFVALWSGVPRLFSLRYDAPAASAGAARAGETFIATHLPTPKPLRAIYMTSFVAGNRARRGELVKLIAETEANAIVIDVKDYTGRISFPVEDPLLRSIGAAENRIPDIREFIAELHKKGIYVIGRISVFQDPHLVSRRPELAVKRGSDGRIWKDRKGITWLDAGAREVWEYVVALGKESHRDGFDELNFDYIRFPSDGDMNDIAYPMSEGKVKAEVLRDFYAYLRERLEGAGPSTNLGQAPTLSIDLFGMTTTNSDDLNIGQVLEYALPYFDYIAPMVYPSHYPEDFIGFKNPAAKPYEVVRYSMGKAFERASTTPEKLRPWLQDFDLGATYTAEMVRKEVQAVYDSGFSSWMLWSPSNRYTPGALLPVGMPDGGAAPLEKPSRE